MCPFLTAPLTLDSSDYEFPADGTSEDRMCQTDKHVLPLVMNGVELSNSVLEFRLFPQEKTDVERGSSSYSVTPSTMKASCCHHSLLNWVRARVCAIMMKHQM